MKESAARHTDQQTDVGRVRLVVFGVSVALLALATLGLLAPNVVPPAVTDVGGAHFIHNVVFVMFVVMLLAGVIAQVGAPRRRPAAILAPLAFPVGMLVLGLSVGFVIPPVIVFLVLTAVAAGTHPARRDLLRPTAPPSTSMLGLAVVGLALAGPYAWDQLATRLSLPATDPHSEHGHWVAMAAIALLAPILVAVASRRPGGWPVLAGLAAASALAVGGASIAYPELPSSLGVVWGAVAMAWGVLVAGAATIGTRAAIRAEA